LSGSRQVDLFLSQLQEHCDPATNRGSARLPSAARNRSQLPAPPPRFGGQQH
jgi:hypothetical protein